MDMIDIAIAKAFATKIAAGFSNVEVDGMTIIFTLNDGTTTSLTVPTPADGVSITGIDIDENGELICTMSDGTEINAGKVLPTKGIDYYTPEEVEEVKENITEELQEQININSKHIQALEDNFDTATTPNSNDFALTDCASGFIPRDNEDKPKEIKIGETELEQVTTTGKNIADTSAITETTFKGVTFSPVYKNGLLEYVDVNGTATETSYIDVATKIYDAGNYILTGSPTGGSNEKYQQRLVKTTGFEAVAVDNGSGVLISINGTDSYFIRIRIASGYTANHLKFYPMLRLASVTDDTYEPYTNGASPSPDYPQDIHIVEGECSVEIKSKNILISTAYNVFGTPNGVRLTKQISEDIIDSPITTNGEYRGVGFIAKINKGRTYTFSTDLTNVTNKSINIYENISDMLDATRTLERFTSTYTFTPSNNGYALIGSMAKSSGTNMSWTYAQLEEGTEATPYTKYKGNNTFLLTLPQGMFLGKIGTSSNYIYGTKDNWKLHSGLAKIVLDGSESGWSKSSYAFTNNSLFTGKPYALCSHFKDAGDVWTSNDESYRRKFSTRNSAGIFKCMPTEDMILTEFKTWLSNNTPELYYSLETSTETNITDTTLIFQLNNMINNLQTYKGGTVVFTTGSNLAPNIQFEYMVNPFASIEARLNLLEA